MEKIEKLIPGNFYHIYNCGINGENLFRDKKDYERFIRLYEKYIFPVCDTYAWVLMKNHFHLMIGIKKNLIYKYSMKDFGYDKEKFNDVKWETSDIKGDLTCQRPQDLTALNNEDLTALKDQNLIATNNDKHPFDFKPTPHLHFSHLFNAYAKYFNIKYERHGSLFERPFNRKEINNLKYFQNVIIYIHQNPVHHGFCDHAMDYCWSSYLTCISLKPTSLKRDAVIGWFNDVGNFKNKHNKTLNRKELEEYLGL